MNLFALYHRFKLVLFAAIDFNIMTNGGDLFSKRTYRQGNVQQSLHPLNDQSNSQPLNVGKVLDDKVELSVARDVSQHFCDALTSRF
jgi:hypothetical protein